jgi:hypothetical protein
MKEKQHSHSREKLELCSFLPVQRLPVFVRVVESRFARIVHTKQAQKDHIEIGHQHVDDTDKTIVSQLVQDDPN